MYILLLNYKKYIKFIMVTNKCGTFLNSIIRQI